MRLTWPVLISVAVHAATLSLLFWPRGSDVIRVEISARQGNASEEARSGASSAVTQQSKGPAHKSGNSRPGDEGSNPGVISNSIADLLRTINYPRAARNAEMHGLVIIECDVTADGYVEHAYVKESSGFGLLDRAAQDGVQRWKFPARGRTFRLRIPVRFSLDDGSNR